MATMHEGSHDAAGRRVAIVAGRYNDFITGKLVDSAVDCLLRHGVESDAIDVYWVAGAFEVPQLAANIARRAQVDGIVCLGAIVRGETNHFDILSESVIRSIAALPGQYRVPVTYGILSTDTIEQANNRAGGQLGNKGWESSMALIEMMSLWEE